MKQLAYKWRLLLRRILIVCSFGALAAAEFGCGDDYGVPSIGGSAHSAGTEEPIPGIWVSIPEKKAVTTTGQYGHFNFEFDLNRATLLLLKDIDGTNNGGEFHDKIITNYTINSNSIYMDRK